MVGGSGRAACSTRGPIVPLAVGTDAAPVSLVDRRRLGRRCGATLRPRKSLELGPLGRGGMERCSGGGSGLVEEGHVSPLTFGGQPGGRACSLSLRPPSVARCCRCLLGGRGQVLEPLGPSWSHPRASWRPLGPSWTQLGRLGALLDRLGAVLDPSWTVLGASWAVLGAS